MRPLLALAVLAVAHTAAAQSTPLPDDDPKIQYEVVSIRKNDSSTPGGSARTMPDGSEVLVNQPVRSIIGGASPVPVREVVGMPDWATRDRYDMQLKPPEGTPRGAEGRAIHGAMLRNMLRERMKFAGHIEEREQTTFALVVARPDGKLGPELAPSTLPCGPRPAGTPPPPPPPPRTAPPSFDEMKGSCGMMMGNGRMVSGGMTLDNFAQSLGNMAGGFVTNKTGLTGFYTLSLTYTLAANRPTTPDPNDPPELTTALQEQLGLKLVPEKTKVPVLVVDHIEPPSAN